MTYTEPSTRRITRLFRESVASGLLATNWYDEARGIAADMAERHGISIEQAVGVIAATSPLMSWVANINLAERLIATRDFSGGYLGGGLRKVERILSGERPDKVLTSDKVANFYRAILTGGREGVVIDRHAYAVAAGVRENDDERPRLTPKQYQAYVDAYVRAARILSAETGEDLTPSFVQSQTWVAWRRKYWSEGAWDPR